MENRIGKCFAFWIKCNKMQALTLVLMILLSFFKGFINIDVLVIWFIIGRLVDLFKDLQLTLPFSRQTVWRTYAVVESGMFMIYIIIKSVQYKDNIGILLLELVCVLAAHVITAMIPWNRKLWWNSFIVTLLITGIVIYVCGSDKLSDMFMYILNNTLTGAVLIMINLVVLVIDAWEWAKQGRLMVRGEWDA